VINWEAKTTFITLSIGGNDLGFSKIATQCMALPAILPGRQEKCEQFKRETWVLINNEDGQDKFYKSLKAAWSSLQYPNYDPIRSPLRTFPNIAHTLYPRFFNPVNAPNSDGNNCDSARIIKSGPLLTEALRREINNMVDAANRKIEDNLRRYMEEARNANSIGRIVTVDPNPYWEGHRLCEPHTGSTPGFAHPNSWFLGLLGPDSNEYDGGKPAIAPRNVDPNTCDPDSYDQGEAIGCEISKAQARGELDPRDLQDIGKWEWVSV
jgi:hypothetical protein